MIPDSFCLAAVVLGCVHSSLSLYLGRGILGDDMSGNFRADWNAVFRNDPAARNAWEVLTYAGLHAIIWHRVAHFFWRHNIKFLARLISQTTRFWTGIEIHPGATIGRGFFIDHGMGVVIGETTQIGDNCTLYQNVTLGGTGKDHGKRHPTLGDNVLVGAGAKVLGPFKVGDNARIAAGAVVLDEVPPNATAVGVPARIVRLNGVRTCNLDQIHVADPVAQEICRLQHQLEQMQNQINVLQDALQKK